MTSIKKFKPVKHPNLLFLCLTSFIWCFAQKPVSIRAKNEKLLLKLEHLIQENGSFKEAVFLCERGFEDRVSVNNYYYDYIKDYTALVRKYVQALYTIDYREADSLNYLLNLALFDVFSKPIPVRSNGQIIRTTPFQYNFDDPQGNKDFSSTFVTRLLATHYGNCRSLAYLYKILADEVGAKCWLALAPNHIYIRSYSKRAGWYNTELTSGTLPTDAWIAASGYISFEAIQNGVYMDTLSNQQAIGLCILDLAQGYIGQTKKYTDGFVLKACSVVLQYHPQNPMALLLKAEALKRTYLLRKKTNPAEATRLYTEMQESYSRLVTLGYREMPYKMYQQWLKRATNMKKGDPAN